MLWLAWIFACTPSPSLQAAPVPLEPPASPPAPAPVWPDPLALKILPSAPSPVRLLLDAGHGAPANSGNRNWRCEAEQDFSRRITDSVAALLTLRGLHPLRTRPDALLVSYPERLRQSHNSDYLISLHSDSRAGLEIQQDAQGCLHNHGAQGFAILWSDEGTAALVAQRQALAHALGRRLTEAGFLPYPGQDYMGLYGQDIVPGVFLDRHEAKKRIMLLRRPAVPSVIIETHQAWDQAEAEAWENPLTHAAFAGALAAALFDISIQPD